MIQVQVQEQELDPEQALEQVPEQAHNLSVTFTKKSLINNISKKEGLSKKDSSFFLEEVIKYLQHNKNSKITLSNFGTFSMKKRPSRVGRNPKTLESYKIPARRKFFFEPSKLIKKILN